MFNATYFVKYPTLGDHIVYGNSVVIWHTVVGIAILVEVALLLGIEALSRESSQRIVNKGTELVIGDTRKSSQP